MRIATHEKPWHESPAPSPATSVQHLVADPQPMRPPSHLPCMRIRRQGGAIILNHTGQVPLSSACCGEIAHGDEFSIITDGQMLSEPFMLAKDIKDKCLIGLGMPVFSQAVQIHVCRVWEAPETSTRKINWTSCTSLQTGESIGTLDCLATSTGYSLSVAGADRISKS